MTKKTPNPKSKPPATRETQAHHEDRVWIRTYRKIFKETDDPIALMQAFTISMKLGLYPPVSILQALNQSFQRVLDGNGAVLLDDDLGLKRPGQGARTAFAYNKSRGLQLWLAVNMHSLIHNERLTIARAAERVSLLTESLSTMRRYSAEGLTDQYSRKWKKQFQRELAMSLTFKPLP